MLVVVAVAFAVGGDVRELGGIAGAGVEAVEEAVAEGLAAVEQAFESDGAGAGAVVEEDGDAAAFVELDAVGLGGVGGGVGGADPGWGGGGGWRCAIEAEGYVCICRSLRLGGDAADAGALDGGEHGELDAL